MFAISKTLNFNYSPLEQFDDVTWVLYTRVLENLSIYNNFIFEIYGTEANFFAQSLDTGFFLSNRTLTLASIIIFFFAVKSVDLYLSLREFSHFFLLAFIHLLTGSFVFAWFDDFIQYKTTLNNKIGAKDAGWEYFGISTWERINYFLFSSQDGDNSEIFARVISPVVDSIDVFHAIPQINFSLAWDENFISFLLAFFLLGGAEEEEDEDFILEEEESDFVEDVVAPLFVSNLGKDVEENGALFLKVSGIFSFVLTNNLMGMLPYSDTGTSSLILTFWVSLAVFSSLLTMLFRKQGVNYFFNLFLPAGTPFPLIFLLIPIEFISYTFRLVSLPVRLFANMMAGHTLLKVIVGFSWSMILMGDFFLIANLFPVAILFILTFLELGVAMIQAYIFTILTCIYLKDVFVAH